MKINGATLTGSTKVSLFKGRYKYIYGVNGGGRGIRWGGEGDAEAIGMQAPTAALTMSTTASTGSIVAAVNVVAQGGGYFQPPTVTFSGGGLTNGDVRHARGLAKLKNGAVAGVLITSAGSGYTSRPQVTLSGARGSGATVTVGVDGGLAAVIPTSSGSGYTAGATISFSNSGGLTGAMAEVLITDGRVSGVRVVNPGSGATTTAAATIYGPGAGAAAACIMSYAVTALTVSGGTGYAGSVPIQFSSLSGSGAAAYCTANSAGAPVDPVITARGAYGIKPTASVDNSQARAEALIREPMKGSYRCGIRYVDNTPISEGGPIPSSMSDLVTVEANNGAGGLRWNWNNSAADSRASAVELWRTSANQAIVLYRIALLPRNAATGLLDTTYSDTMDEATLIDPTRAGYALLPITLPSGQLNAYRFEPPPTDMEDACWFQDRAWYGGNTSGTRPNTLLFSEVDEPESVPSVNEIVIQNNTGSQDRVVALIPYGAMMLVAQERHMYRLTYVAQPIIDAAVTLAGYRGILNKRCWTSFEGGLYCVDSFGMYALDGSSMEPLSVAVDNYWRDSVIDFSKSVNFFVQADPQSRVIRFHYCKSSDSSTPPRALCYSLATKTWWEETYPQGIGSAAVIRVGGKQSLVCGSSAGQLLKASSGMSDSGSVAIPYELRTGPLTITDEPTRQIGVLYQPTAADLTVRVHYNNASTYRPNAIFSDRGEGVTASETGVVINMRPDRSALGDSTGYSTARYSGRANDRSSGSDRHLAVDLSGEQSTSPVVLHGVTIGGVTA